MLKITLDTNEIINPNQAALVVRVKELASRGKVDYGVVTRVEADKDQDKDLERQTTDLNTLEKYTKIGTIMRCGFSVCGSGDFCGDTEVSNQIERILFGKITSDKKHSHNMWSDVDHLTGHYLSGRDVFVTEDKAILRKAKELDKLGIKVEKLEALIHQFSGE